MSVFAEISGAESWKISGQGRKNVPGADFGRPASQRAVIATSDIVHDKTTGCKSPTLENRDMVLQSNGYA